MEIELKYVLLSLIPNGIPLIAWVIAIVFAVRMFKKSRQKAEKYLLVGASLMASSSVIGVICNVLNPWIVLWVHDTWRGAQDLGIVLSIIGGFRSLISLAGIVYLVIAFWKKFRMREQQ